MSSSGPFGKDSLPLGRVRVVKPLGSNLRPDPAGVVGKLPAYMGKYAATPATTTTVNFVAPKPSNWADGDTVKLGGKVFCTKRTGGFASPPPAYDVLVDLSALTDADGPEGVLAVFRTAIEGNTAWRLSADGGGDTEHAVHTYTWTGDRFPDDVVHLQFPWARLASHEAHFDLGPEVDATTAGVTMQTGVGVLDIEKARLTVAPGSPARIGLYFPAASDLADNDHFQVTAPVGAAWAYDRNRVVEIQATGGFVQAFPGSLVVDIRGMVTADEVASAFVEAFAIYDLRAVSWNRPAIDRTEVVWEVRWTTDVAYGFTSFSIASGPGKLDAFGGVAGTGDLGNTLDFRARSAIYALLHRGVFGGIDDALVSLTLAEYLSLLALISGPTPAPPDVFTAVGGETDHVFTGLSAGHRYRLKLYCSTGGGGFHMYLNPDSDGTGNNARGVRSFSGAPANVQSFQDTILDLGSFLPGHGEWEISPRFNGFSLVKGVMMTTELTTPAAVNVNGGTSINFTSLQFALSGGDTFAAGDVLELIDLGTL